MKTFNYIATGIVIVITIGLYLLFAPEEKTYFFYTNLALTIGLELLALWAIFTVSSKQRYNLQNIATTKQILTFVVLIALWMVVYNLLPVNTLDEKWFFAILLLIILPYTFIILFTHQGGKVQQEVNQAMGASVAMKNYRNIDYQMFKFNITELTDRIEGCVDQKKNMMNTLTLLIEKLRVLSPQTIQKNPSFGKRMEDYMTEIHHISDTLDQSGSNRSAVLDQIDQTVKQAIKFIDIVKPTLL